ncbi:transmembrane protein 117-like [Schistocerca serialis cubense]|uniref:transmembrane protein 117-like n=1 Tax=Schistocerca serialis cubense TaxID=2023355 RepID=UPI00214E0C1D|nr:transmembrane protein 117-like [Schistocerca serialis cubense]
MASPQGRKSLLSLGNWTNFMGRDGHNNNNNNNNNSNHHQHHGVNNNNNGGGGVRNERSGSSSSRDFWSRVSQQMSYIDGSTRSNSILSTGSGYQPQALPPPPLPHAHPAGAPHHQQQSYGGGSTTSGGCSPPESRAGGSIYENYYQYADIEDEEEEEEEEEDAVGGRSEEALELQPLSRAATCASHHQQHQRPRPGRLRRVPTVLSATDRRRSTLEYYKWKLGLSRNSFCTAFVDGERVLTQAPPRKASSWEEGAALQRRRSVMLMTAAAGAASAASGVNNSNPGVAAALLAAGVDPIDKRDLRYYFQHPYPRLFVTYFVIFCNFLIFAEDPISHSHTESTIPIVGNVFSFVLTKYPPEWRWSLIKVLMWLLAILCGMIVGKLLIHGYLCGSLLRLKMFRDDQGSWMTMFLTVIVSLYVFSHGYNLLLALWYDNCLLHINSDMGVTNASVMKAAACGTWLGDLITALMVTDMMLQDNLYPQWARRARAVWRRSNVPRILLFWVGSVVATAVVVTLIVSDWISWDHLNQDFLSTTELSRAFLASFILVMDLLIVMQDWDFPHFTTTLHVNLPGFSVATLQWKYAEVDITGKWFNYGIIFLVMLLDLNMWKNQIFYDPKDFGQYTGPDDKVRTVNEPEILSTGNSSLWTWEYRSQINPQTGLPFYEEDMQMNSRYMNYPLSVKWTAFIPSGIGLILFVSLVSLYGRFPSNQDPVGAMFRSLTTLRQGFTLQGIGVHTLLERSRVEQHKDPGFR